MILGIATFIIVSLRKTTKTESEQQDDRQIVAPGASLILSCRPGRRSGAADSVAVFSVTDSS